MGDWDDILLRVLRQCPQSNAVLTTVPPMARLDAGVGGTFLGIEKSGEAPRPRPFAMPPARPQPSIFASAQMCFGPTTLVVGGAPARGVNVYNEDLVLSQSLWMCGANFYAPQASVLHTLNVQIDERTVRKLDETWEPRASARTAREWVHFSGRRAKGWSRRAQLGLTSGAGHEERFAKYGDQLDLHGL